jgi:hypothetical protein
MLLNAKLVTRNAQPVPRNTHPAEPLTRTPQPATRNSVSPQVHIDQAEFGGLASQLNGAVKVQLLQGSTTWGETALSRK